MIAILRFNFASPGGDPRTRGKLLSTALELAQWADSRGVFAISVDEHHATGHGWSNNPVMAASMFLARTSSLVASIDCALGPLWNPARLAEDIALVDAFSGGRLHTTIGLGYRPVEYDLLGADFDRRGELMDTLLDTMLGIWSDGTVPTRTRPHPPIYVGGAVRATARRAVRFGLPLNIPDYKPELAAYYTELCEAAGLKPFVVMQPPVNRGMIYLHPDPDQAWAQYGDHILWEATTYGQWADGKTRSIMHLPGVQTLDEVKASGRYRILTPEQLIAEVRGVADYGPIVLHPLVGGLPTEHAWTSVQLLTDTVLPALNAT
jgi:alkanesulfonate monooxygenase SsuD/methylene tetrahydromethanopterin reductase-like flavin-dependent oxidoreductase (luciferase family)